MGMDEAKAKHVVMVKTILDTTVIIVIYSIEKTIPTTKGRIIQRHNLKRGWNHKANILVRMNAIGKHTSHIPIVLQNIWLKFIKSQ